MDDLYNAAKLRSEKKIAALEAELTHLTSPVLLPDGPAGRLREQLRDVEASNTSAPERPAMPRQQEPTEMGYVADQSQRPPTIAAPGMGGSFVAKSVARQRAANTKGGDLLTQATARRAEAEGNAVQSPTRARETERHERTD